MSQRTTSCRRRITTSTHVPLMSGLQIGEDHPLSLELASLKATVARYQVGLSLSRWFPTLTWSLAHLKLTCRLPTSMKRIPLRSSSRGTPSTPHMPWSRHTPYSKRMHACARRLWS